MQFIYLQASVKDVQATGEAINPQNRTSSTSFHEISSHSSIFWVIFPLQDPDQADQIRLVRILADPDPNPQHCILPQYYFSFSSACLFMDSYLQYLAQNSFTVQLKGEVFIEFWIQGICHNLGRVLKTNEKVFIMLF